MTRAFYFGKIPPLAVQGDIMRVTILIIAAVMVLQFCGCDGEMWISTGDNGWTSDFGKPWPPTQPAASAGGSTSTGHRKKTGTTKTSNTAPAKTEKLEMTLAVPATAQPGKIFTCSFTVKNSTGAELKNLVIDGLLPNGLKVAGTQGPAVMHWKLASLAAGEAKSFTAALQAPAEGSYLLESRATADGGKIASANVTIKIAKEEQKK